MPAAEEPAEFLLHTAGNPVRRIPASELKIDLAGDLLEARRAGLPLPPPPVGEQLIFANGDRIPGSDIRLAGERVVFRPALGGDGELSVPVGSLAVVWLAAPDNAADDALVRRRLAGESRTKDTVLLRNGDAVTGVLTGLDDKEAAVEVEKKTVTVKRDRLAAVAFSTELSDPLRPKGPYARVVLANGGRLSLATAAVDGNALAGRTLFDAPVRLPLDRLVALYVLQGRAVYLSDLKPSQYEHTPYLGVRWPWVADGSVAGHDLGLADGTHDKGLGLHSQSRITYQLSGAYRRFEALAGLDGQTGRRGQVRLRVLVDGKPASGESEKELAGREKPWAVRVDVTGARTLTLVVEFGRGGDVGDHVNWADARLVK